MKGNTKPRRKCTILKICLFLLFVVLGAAHNQEFKTCNQNSFCKRLRSPPEISPFKVLEETLNETANGIEGSILNTDTSIMYSFLLQFLVDDTIRLKINEAKVTCPRYHPLFVLVSEPQPAPFLSLSVENEVRIYRMNAFTVKMFTYPFKLEVFQDDKSLIVVNDLHRFVFEHHRPKPQESAEYGEWFENFQLFGDVKRCGPMAVGMDFSFPSASNIYGLPLHADNLSLRSTKNRDPYRLYNVNVQEYEIGKHMALHGAVPFIHAHGILQTVGVFWLNASETWVDIDDSIKEIKNALNVHFISETGIVDVFLFLGRSFYDVMRQYSNLTGTAPLPPYFSLGSHQAVWNDMKKNVLQETVQRFGAGQMSLDVICLNIQFTSFRGFISWNAAEFPKLPNIKKILAERRQKLMVLTNPFIITESSYFVHNGDIQSYFFLKHDYTEKLDVGYLDFFNPAAADYWSRLFLAEDFEELNDLYVYNDKNEPFSVNGPELTIPKDFIHFGNWEHREVHNVYGMKNVMATYEGLLKRSGGSKRPFILTQSHFAGTQRYAAVSTGPNQANWSHLKASYAMCLSSALAGISFCGANIGGFYGKPDEQLLMRWYQAAVYLPLFRSDTSELTVAHEPFKFQGDTYTTIFFSIRDRLSLIPFFYTLFWQHMHSGSPVIRPLVMEFPTEEETFEIDDQLLLGKSILVKAVSEPDVSSVDVYFPGQNEIWYRKLGGERVTTQGYRSISVTPKAIPVYYRGGSIIPEKFPYRISSTLSLDFDYFVLKVSLDINKTAHGFLYLDEGDSFSYRNGKYVYMKFSYSNNQIISRFMDEGRFETKNQIINVDIVGVADLYEYAVLQSDKITTECEVSYIYAEQKLAIKTKSVLVNKEWTISLVER